MVDTGATAEGFIDESFALQNNFTLHKLRNPRRLNVVDGRPSSAGDITHIVKATQQIKQHQEHMFFYVTKLGKFDIILGKPWLDKHNPYIDWTANIVTFNSKHCQTRCLFHGVYQICVHGSKPPTYTCSATTIDPPPLPKRVSAREFLKIAKHRGVEISAIAVYDIDKELASRGIVTGDSTFIEDSTPKLRQWQQPSQYSNGIKRTRQMVKELRESCQIAPPPPTAASKNNLARRQCAAEMYLSGASIEDIRIALEPKIFVDPVTKVPTHFHNHLKVFDQARADQLPPHRDSDHEIKLIPDSTPPHGPLYSMSEDELLVLRKFLQENLDKGFIRASTSPAASPVLFVKKPGGGLRFCVDYRALNALTIKNRYPLPLIRETLHQLSQAKFFTKLDVVGAFNRIRVKEGDEWLTAFNTRYGLFESLVMPFGLSNAPATFQAYINQTLRPFLDIFCTAYIDDVLIFSDDLESHRKHVHAILQALEDAGLQLDVKKCEFEQTEVKYLGMIISTNGVRMDPEKVASIVEWETPTTLKDVQAFLGFSNFYRRFIKGFSRIVKPIVALTKGDAKNLKWTPQCTKSFEILKEKFISAPILQHFDPTKEIIVQCDASDYVSSGILLQKGEDDELHPVAFMSKKYNEAECNYEIYDKELLAIVRCFEDWKSELQGTEKPITVLSDHANLRYFMTTKALSRRQVRWSEFLSQYDFVIKAIPGKDNILADSLTRRSQDLPKDGSDVRVKFQNQTLLKPENVDLAVEGGNKLDRDLSELFANLSWDQEIQLSPAILTDIEDSTDIPTAHTLTRLFAEGYDADTWWHSIRDEMCKGSGTPQSKDIALSECTITDNRLYFRGRLYVPQWDQDLQTSTNLRTTLLQLAHDSTESGHPGKNKMYELIARDYFWPKMSYDVRQFTRNCHSCMRNKVSRLQYQGALKPLPVPLQRWKNIAVDFVGPLKTTPRGFDTIMVVTDRLSKDRHFTPCVSTMGVYQLGQLFVRDVWKLHGLPSSIVSDRDKLFVAQFWKAICHRLQIDVNLSTAYHKETDGQSENAISFMSQYLRQYVDFAQDDWDEWLPLAEFAARNAVNSSTGMTPFFANHAYHPRLSFGPPLPILPGASEHLKAQNQIGLDFVAKMEEILGILRTNMISAQASQEQFANLKRTPTPAYRVGDEVLLSTKNLKLSRPTRKFDQKYIGPYPILEVINEVSYKLKLDAELGAIHDVFHVNLLRPAPNDPLPGQFNKPAPPIAIDAEGHKLWAIETILKSSRTRKDGFRYLIKWRGFDEPSWEPLHNVITARASIAEFQRVNSGNKSFSKPTTKEKRAAYALLNRE